MAPDYRKRNRKSIRLKGYDYRQSGWYFVTIETANFRPLFGQIQDGKMVLNDAGRIADACWRAIPEHFPNVQLDEWVIMPDHIHGLFFIVEKADERPNPDRKSEGGVQKPRGTSRTVGSIIRGFKIGVTKWMRANTVVQNVWKRDYYERIVWNHQSLAVCRS